MFSDMCWYWNFFLRQEKMLALVISNGVIPKFVQQKAVCYFNNLGARCLLFSAERAQISRTPMSSCQDYASRRPQEPWKYLDIHFAPPLVCSAIQCIIFCGRETRFQVARGRTLKVWSCIFFIVWLHFSHSAGAKLRPHPISADCPKLILHPSHVFYHCRSIDSFTVVL